MKRETPEEVRKWFIAEAAELWPVSLGSVSLRKNKCIRKNCYACANGEGHPTYALHFRDEDGVQHGIYIPDDLSAEMERAVLNGRRLKALLLEAGQRYLKARKAERSGL